jgi:hypothetical protein
VRRIEETGIFNLDLDFKRGNEIKSWPLRRESKKERWEERSGVTRMVFVAGVLVNISIQTPGVGPVYRRPSWAPNTE